MKPIFKPMMVAAALLALGGCTVGPRYTPAADTLGDVSLSELEFSRDDGLWKTAAPADTLPKGDWWAVFGDPVLSGLLERCRADNPTLAAAYYRMEEAREAAMMTRAQLFPWLSGDASYARFGNSKNLETTIQGTYNDWALGAGLTWDADLFGRVRDLLRADVANAEALRDAYQSALLALQTNVANAYFTLRQYVSEIALLERTLSVRKEQTELVRKRVQMDFSTDLDLQRALEQEYEASAQLSSVQRQLALTQNLMAALLGTTPSQFKLDVPALSDVMPALPRAVPSELLERRPDVAAAERAVFAANARIGAATAAFFPTISITGNAGVEATDVKNLLNASSFAWGINPRVYIPLFQAGRLIAERKVALAAHKRTLEDYRATVLSAIREVEDALSDVHHLATEYDRRRQVSDASKKVEELTRKQYDFGFVDYFSVSDAQRLALLNERECLRIQGNRFRACVSMVGALGGGWNVKTAPTPLPPQAKR